MPTFSLLPSREERVAFVECCNNTLHSRMADRVLSPDARHLSLRPLLPRRCCTREKTQKRLWQITSDARGINRHGTSIHGARLTARISPMVRAYKSDAKLLMIGVDYNTSTYIHLVEVIRWNKRLTDDSQATFIGLNRPKLGAFWDALGKLRQGKVGDSDCRLFHINTYVNTLLAEVERNPKPYVG